MRKVLVPPDRVERWCDGFESRHGGAAYQVSGGGLVLRAPDGAAAVLRLPFDRVYDGPPEPAAYVEAAPPPACWGLLVVRKGGFAVALLAGAALQDHKIGRRHVQGRTKAGGQSQQRFARRRDNQARAAYEAAAEHATRILAGADLAALVTGGDRAAVDAVLADRRLARLVATRTSRWLPVPDPTRAVLDRAVADAAAVEVDLTDP